MAEPKGKKFLFLECPVCQGTGHEGDRECSRCGERGMFAWLDNEILQWSKKIDTLHIFEEALERTVNAMINGFLIFFGVVGLLSLVVTIVVMVQEQANILEFWKLQNGLMGIFAISLLTDLYAYYRLQRQSLNERTVKKKSFETFLTEEDARVLFDQATQLDNKKIIEVSDAYTATALRVVEGGWQMAKRLKHNSATPLHILATLLGYPDTQVVLARLGLDGKILVEKISRSLQKIPRATGAEVSISTDYKRVLIQAYAEAYNSRREQVDVPQLLMAVVKIDDTSRDILYDMEIEQEEVVNVVEWLNIQHRFSQQWRKWRSKAVYKSKGVMNKSMTAQATPLLDRFANDLTQLAQRGILSPTIGRDKEIEETLRIIEGGKNVILSGNPGVGKTSIVEGIAELMASEEVPEVLQDKRFVSLSIASLVGAAGRQGELEGILLEIINEVARSGNILLFIDNIQNMVGVSTQGSQNLDIAEMFASALQKGLFYCIATTTPQDYRRYIEPSSALTSVFQKVSVEEPDINGAILVLEGKASSIEAKNDIYFSYEAIERTVKLSERYIQDRYLPEKAISLLQEIAVYVRKKRGKGAIVRGEDVAEIISTRTNVPITKITEKESAKLLNLEEHIHERMIDQAEAVSAVATALRRARAELRDVSRPIVNLLFLGPTGVGKTELAKTVAEVYFGSEENMIRLDMSEYQERSSINRLIGAPPGMAGGTKGGFLTEAVRSKPFSLVLLDEIEKAHPDILNIFLQVMDDGRLTDTQGRTINFSNVILIATSNAGTSMIQDRMKANIGIDQIKEELINEGLKAFFRPEFLNRFDNIVVFKPLAYEEILQIVDLMLNKVAERLSAKGISLEVTPEAKEELAKDGYDPVFGARPLRRAIQNTVDNALATYLLQGKLSRRDVAVLEPGGKITVKRAEAI
ncbi:ATP-dependent Clp protease ATP-binding subunit [Patescibacteria group bacterium]|nr:ATP-dependent Clp protease ATP-binding subunit [Patescibacteria group bacterium]